MFGKILRLGLVCLAVTAAAAGAHAQSRIALVIGNSDYREAPLANPANDARLMARTLKGLGFDIIEVLNADQKTMKRAVRDFGAKIERAGKDTVGLFYYAGHGIQVKGENFLIPVNAPIAREADVSIEAVSAGAILEQLAFAKNRLNIVILDACRNNPFKRSFRSANAGLARMDAPTGSIVAYSTAPGSVASDGSGSNGTYTAALARAMTRTGLKVEDVFKLTRRQVITETAEAQVPWESSSLVGDFYFAGRPTAAPGPAEVMIVPAPQPGAEGANRPLSLAARPPAPAHTPGRAGQEFADCPDCPAMVTIPAGSFTMGSKPQEIGRIAAEGPARRVKVRRFAIGKHEITRGQFRRFVKETGYNAESGCWYWFAIWIHDKNRSWKNPGYEQTDDHPAVCISWDDARAYARWLSRKTGKKYRLPAEAEWEYAARGGSQDARFWGNGPNDACAYGNVYDNASANRWHAPWAHHACNDGYSVTAPVGTFKPNAFGLYDMLGNVPEWVADCSAASYKGHAADGTAYASRNCGKRVLRGGGWNQQPNAVRSASRLFDEPFDREVTRGFRIVRELE